MKRIHYIDQYLLNPSHPITVALIGCGGTGSSMITQLGRIHHTLTATGHPGLQVTVFDPDSVSEANIGRQLFSPSELGLNKAKVLATKVNRFFGTQWIAEPLAFEPNFRGNKKFNFYLTCVDTAASRFQINELLQEINHFQEIRDYYDSKHAYYWLDTGNTKDGGQVILGSIHDINQPKESAFECVKSLPTIIDKFPDLKEYDTEEQQGPSCSIAQAIQRQDLFINSLIAQYAGSFLWNFLKEGLTIYNGIYTSIPNYKTNPIKI